jgi:hypothetical protein
MHQFNLGSGSLNRRFCEFSWVFSWFKSPLAIPWKVFLHNSEKKNIEPFEEQRIVFAEFCYEMIPGEKDKICKREKSDIQLLNL